MTSRRFASFDSLVRRKYPVVEPGGAAGCGRPLPTYPAQWAVPDDDGGSMTWAGLAAGLTGTLRLPPRLLAALVPLLVLNLALDIFCLIDLARAKSVRGAPKVV